MGLFKKMKDKKIKEQQKKELLEKHRKMFLDEMQKENSKNIKVITLEEATSTMGNLKFNGSFYIGSIEGIIFDKSDFIKLLLFVDDETEPQITKEHLETYKHIIENQKTIENDIINELKNNYQISDSNEIKNKFKPNSIMIFGNGNSGIEFDDLDEPRGFSSKNIVVEITPKISYYGSVEDYA